MFIANLFVSILLLAVCERFMLAQVKRLVREEWISQDQEQDLRCYFQESGFSSHGTKGPVITVMFSSLFPPSRTLNLLTIFSLYPIHTFYLPTLFTISLFFYFQYNVTRYVVDHTIRNPLPMPPHSPKQAFVFLTCLLETQEICSVHEANSRIRKIKYLKYRAIVKGIERMH